jgi:hypothetical protein
MWLIKRKKLAARRNSYRRNEALATEFSEELSKGREEKEDQQ